MMKTPWFANRYTCHAGSGKTELSATIEYGQFADFGAGWNWFIESDKAEASMEDEPFPASGFEKTLAKAKAAASKALKELLSR